MTGWNLLIRRIGVHYDSWHCAKIPCDSELYIHIAYKYSCFKFGTFYIVDGRRLLITESLSCKNTISGRSESSTCVLSKHIRKKGDQMRTPLKPLYTFRIPHSMSGMTVREQEWRLIFPKDGVSLSSMLVICFSYGATDSPQWATSSSFTRFLDHPMPAPHSVRLLWMGGQLVAETSTW